MPSTTLVIGGCRSGKSKHGLKLAADMQRRPMMFLATCSPHDEEMRRRIQRHQQERGPEWKTLEVPTDLAEAIARHGNRTGIILVDCLTLWISNLMLEETDQQGDGANTEQIVRQKCAGLCDILKAPPCPIILVSNEVGAGIVPENRLARQYRDLAGWTNQQIAAACQAVVWMIAGIPVPIKP